jgi:hypothetical protein
MALLLIMLLAAEQPAQPLWEIKETATYSPFDLTSSSRSLAISDKGDVFILDVNETRLLQFNAEGKPVKVVANMGEGPGELNNPAEVRICGDRLYVLEMAKRSLHSYYLDGRFDRDYPFPGTPFVLAVAGVSNGWAMADWEFSRDLSKPISISLYDRQMKKTGTLDSWQRKQNDMANVVPIDQKERIVFFNPAKERHFMVASKDGSRLFVNMPGQRLGIKVFDMTTNRMMTTIRDNDIEPIPFSEDWGRERLDAYKAITINRTNGHSGGLRAVEPVFPDKFPIVRDMFLAVDDTLVVSLWTGLPDKRTRYLTFDMGGKPKKSKLSDQAITRVAAIIGDVAYVTTFDEEEGEAGIATCRLADVDAFIKANPITMQQPLNTGILVPK